MSTSTSPPTSAAPPAPQPPIAPRPLIRSRKDRMVGGVCGGLGHYFSIDPVWFRAGFIVFAFGGGSSLLLYLLLWIVVPEGDEPPVRAQRPRPPTSVLAGLALVAVGAMILLNQLAPSAGRYFWPVVLVTVGLALVIGGRTRDHD